MKYLVKKGKDNRFLITLTCTVFTSTWLVGSETTSGSSVILPSSRQYLYSRGWQNYVFLC